MIMPQQQPYSLQQQPPPSASESTAVRAYPIEAEKALEAWMADKEQQGIWTSPAGWWYAAWMHREAEVAQLRSDLAHAQAGWSTETRRLIAEQIESVQLRAQLAERDSQLATLQVQKEGWIRSGQQVRRDRSGDGRST